MPPKAGAKKSKAAKMVTNKRRRGFIDPDLRTSKKQQKKDDAKFVRAKFGNIFDGKEEDRKNRRAAAADAGDGSDSDGSYVSSDDEDARNALGRKPPKVRKRHFKTFAERVGEVDVDVHRTTGELRTAPVDGSSNFLHETLLKWQELNCGADFGDFGRETMQLCQSLPQLVLHQNQVLDALLAKLRMDARHSLEALLACLSSLARDLRADFLTRLGDVTHALSRLLMDGAEREPELLEYVFACLARVLKWTQRQLAADLPLALRHTRSLRRHRSKHVRLFAAQAAAFLLRAAPDAAVEDGVRALIDEATSKHTTVTVEAEAPHENDNGDGKLSGGRKFEERTRAVTKKEMMNNSDAAGSLLAEAMKGAAHGLHSRAPRLLTRVLRPALMTKETSDEEGGGGDDEEDTGLGRLARAYAVAEGAIDSLAKHTRRGKCGVMWTHVMRAARRACAEAGGEKPEPDEEADEDEDDESEDDEDERAAADGVNAAERAARSLGLVATAVEVYNGARVEDYEPIFNLIKRSALPALKKAAADESEQTLSSLSSSTHRLCLACVDAHNKVAGASRGPESITRAAGDWGVALAKAPPGDAFLFVSSLRQRAAEGAPAAAAALSALLPAVAPAIARLLDLGWSGDTGGMEEDDARGGSSVIDADAAAGLLGDVCDVLSRDGHLGTGEALVLSAAPKAAAEIAARCESSSQGSARKGSKRAPGPPARRRWALLRVLPHCADIHGVRRATGDAIAWALQTLGAEIVDGLPAADASYASAGAAKDAAAVLAAATAARAAAGPEPSDENVDAAIAAASALSAGEYPAALSAAADLLAGASDPNAVGSFMDAVAAHQSSLKSPSRHMRVGALRYLCAVADAVGECDADDARAAGANDTPANLAECLHRWLKVNEVDVHDTSNGPNVMEFAKTAQVSIAAIRRAVEQEVLGAECAQTLATCGLGALHIRLASVWPETYKLFGALTERKEFEAAWTVLFDDLNEYQVLCLDAHDAAAINAAEHGRKKGEWRDGEGGGEGRCDDAHANAAAEALQRRMENETVPTEQGTERWQRLGLLLRSVASSPPAASRHPAPLAKLFLAFNAPKPDGNRRAGKAWRAGLREWLKVIRDGLSGGKAVRAMTGTGDAVRVILERCVGADEPDLAQLAVRCLGQWRLPHLTADNADRLARVADPNTMKDELISMRVEPGETEEQRACVEPEHRPAFASLVVRCLLPRLKRRTGRFAPHRVAALRWIGKLDPAEIVPLIHSVISPMEPTAVRDVNDVGEDTHGMMVPNKNTPWLDALVVTASGSGGDAMANAWLQLAKDANVSSLVGSGSKVPSGFLRAAGDLLKVMAEHTKAYLHPLMSLTVEMLGASSEICESAARSREARRVDQIEPEAADDDADADDGDQIEPEDVIEDVGGEAKGVIAPGQAHRDAREVRVLAVRLLGALFERHPDFDYSPYWTGILHAVRPMAERMPAESAAPTPPPALAIVAALADDDALAPLLEGPGAESLLTQLWRALGAPFASPATRAAALAAAESLIERAEEAHWARKRREGDDEGTDTEHVSSRLLRAHAPALLDALQAALAARAARGRRAQTPGSKIAAATEKGAARNAGVSSGSSGRELAVLKRLGPLLGRAAASAAIADTLVPVLALRRLDENAASEVLGALAAVVPPPDELHEDADRAAAATAAARHRSALAPLFGRLRSRSARKALCHAWNAIGRHDVAADACAKILNDFHADAKNSIDGIDYDTRLGAYDLLTAEWFLAAPPASSVPVLNHVIHELRGADMALRHAAAAALGRFLDAAVRSGSMSGDVKVVDDDDDDEDDEVDAEADDVDEGEEKDDEKDGDDDSGERKAKAPTDAVDADDFDPVAGMSTAAERAAEAAKASEASLAGAVAGVLAPGIRGLLRSPEATTRQEAIACFRRLALSWPSAAPGAATLADDADAGEHDFFSNMGHLQAHRRCRALRKMAKACEDGAVPFATINGYLAPLAVASLGDGGADVASTAAATIGSLAAALPWASYRDLLLWMLRKAGGNRAARRGFNVEGSKALHIRAAATVLESFHEFETETETLSGVGATNVVGRSIHPAVVATLRADILPHLEKLTVVEDKEGKGGTVRPAASAAVVSLLRLLPEQDLNFDIGRVLGKIANCLRSRAQGVRDSARTALAVAAKGLGCKTLPQVVALLSNRLDRGFMTHVLGATLFSLVDACVHGADPMDVENALDEIVPLLDADLFGRAAEERTVDAIRGAYQEAKRCRSHEVLAILAANAPCPSALPTLLSPVTRRLHTAHVPALKRQIEACLASVQKGVLNNKHAVPEETLVLVHSVVNDGISQEERQAEYMEAVAQGHLEDNQLGARRRGEKETGNRVWERGW
jgi:U3 small nucleolar RNA-associated protein 20